MATKSAASFWPVLVTLPAEIDVANADNVREQIAAAALKPGVTVIIADMTATTFCDSTGISALLQVRRQAARNGAELRLLRPSRNFTRILKLLGADRFLMVCESLEEAMMPSPP